MTAPQTFNGLYEGLVLASTSAARKRLLTTLGVPFRVVDPEVNENVPAEMPVRQAVATLAERKARAVYRKHPNCLVVGSDQMVAFEGKALGKPPDAATAMAQLLAMVGKSHEVVTGLCVIGPGFLECEVDVAKLTMAPLERGPLERYVETGEWRGCAGGYRVEGRGQALFSEIDGDRTGIEGLPMALLVRLLREAQVQFFT